MGGGISPLDFRTGSRKQDFEWDNRLKKVQGYLKYRGKILDELNRMFTCPTGTGGLVFVARVSVQPSWLQPSISCLLCQYGTCKFMGSAQRNAPSAALSSGELINKSQRGGRGYDAALREGSCVCLTLSMSRLSSRVPCFLGRE